MRFNSKLSVISSALLMLGAASGASAQVVTCAAGDPVFLVEGPVSAVTPPDANGVGTITAMGVTFQVPPGIPVVTPTNSELGMAGFADQTPFPGRDQPGFIGATVTANGCVKFTAGDPAATPPVLPQPFAVAGDVISDVNENVLLGAVSANTGTVVSILGTPVSVLTDARMPGPTVTVNGAVVGTWTRGGIPVTTESIPLGANAALEGYFANDGTYYVWSVDVAGGTPRLNVAQTGIIDVRCGPVGAPGRLQVTGGSFTPSTITPAACNETLTFVNAADPNIVFGTGTVLATVPPSAFCEYLVRFDVAACPANVTVLNSNGSFATTAPGGAPPLGNAPVAVNDGPYLATLNTVLTVAVPGVLVNDTDADVGNTLTANLLTQAANGEVAFSPDGSFTYTPDLGFVGNDAFTYQAVNNTGLLSNIATVTITVGQAANGAPVINSAPVLTATAGVQYTYQVVAVDPDGNALSYALVGAPAGMAINANGLITWTPTAAQVGPNAVTVQVSDNAVPPLSATQSFTVTVAPAPQPNLLDLDINRFTVTSTQRVNRTVVVSLRVTNPSTVTTGTAPATVVGVLNGATVYNRSLQVSSAPGVTTTFRFPDFTPAQTGTVNWTATIADQDPDVDSASATTVVIQ